MAERRAVAAVRFDPGTDQAPEVLAAGHGHHAQRILDLAAEHGIPVREDPLLAQALAQLADGTEIPPQLYMAVAEALLWAWEADRDTQKLRAAARADHENPAQDLM